MGKQKIYLLPALSIFLLDRTVKFFVFKIPALANGVFVYDGVFGMQGYLNRSFAWGLPLSNRTSVVLMLLIGFVLSLVFLRQRRREGLLLPFVFIFLGAASNLFDRLYFGGVIDYIVLPFGGAVNLADVMIAIGLILILEIRN